tara:strand:- start:260 stop:949 length:690 start_codon:yes stop_codon:yes gene_type:complete
MKLHLSPTAELIPNTLLPFLATPFATKTHHPVPHSLVYDFAMEALEYEGLEVVAEEHALTNEGDRYFAHLTLSSPDLDWSPSIILANSHDKRLAVRVGVGSHVFCCDNLAFWANEVVKRKHTSEIFGELPGLISTAVRNCVGEIGVQSDAILRMKNVRVWEPESDIFNLYERNILRKTDVVKVWEHFNNPQAEWVPDSQWCLFNAATAVMEGRVMSDPRTTIALHNYFY